MSAVWSPLVACCFVFLTCVPLVPQKSVYDSQPDIPTETWDRLKYPGWWPTKATGLREEFVGPAECAKCHSEKARSWSTTPMAHASMPAKDFGGFANLEPLNFHAGPFEYEIANRGADHSYSVGDGKNSLATSLLWVFGQGQRGQTYIYRRDGVLYESRLSYYKSIQALDVTAGQEQDNPVQIEEALGRAMNPDTARRCFACHTTASVTANGFDSDQPFNGVTCEACHGPGAKHVAAMKAKHFAEGRAAILNPSLLRPVASVEFCGACHRTWADGIRTGGHGVSSVRFQPYRLEESRCWGEGDTRLTCVSCHDPHEPLVSTASFYDRKCLACHITGTGKPTREHPGKACRAGVRNCVMCHMPQVVVPAMHSSFTDHRIRIARAGKPYPE